MDMVNSSRGIIYAGEDAQFASKARDVASNIQKNGWYL